MTNKTFLPLMRRAQETFTLCCVIILFSQCAKHGNERDYPIDSPTTVMKLSMKASDASQINSVINGQVYLYIFDDQELCMDKIYLSEGDLSYNKSVPYGTYSIIAVANASEVKYDLPEKDSATKGSLISLKNESSNVYDPIMIGEKTIQLTYEEQSTIDNTIELKNVFAKVDVNMTNIPSEINSISMSFSGLNDQLHLNGTTTKTQNPSDYLPNEVIEKSANGVWNTANSVYIFPADKDVETKMMINFLYSSGEISEVSLVLTNQVKPNTPIQINIDNKNGTLSANISTQDWEETVVLNYEIAIGSDNNTDATVDNPDDENTNNNDDITYDTNIPELHSIWNDCIVLSVTENNDGSADLILLSTEEWKIEGENYNAALQIANDYEIRGINTWQLMETTELDLLNSFVGNYGGNSTTNTFLIDAGYEKFRSSGDGYLLVEGGESDFDGRIYKSNTNGFAPFSSGDGYIRLLCNHYLEP